MSCDRITSPVSGCIGTHLANTSALWRLSLAERNTQSTNRRFVRWVYFALKRRGLCGGVRSAHALLICPHHSTPRTSSLTSRFRPWLADMNRSSVSLRMIVLRPTLRTGSFLHSTSFRMVLRPMPLHSAASSIVIPILIVVIDVNPLRCTYFATTDTLL